MINFVEKDIGEMFPQWDSDVEDPAAENIIKVMFNQRPWKWTMDCWEVTGTWINTKPAVVTPAKKHIVVVKEDSPSSPRLRKKARKEAPAEAHEEASVKVPTEARAEVTTSIGGMTKEDIERSFKDLADSLREGFGTCLKEIKHLSDRMEAVKKKVDITRKGTSSNDLQNTTSPTKQTPECGVSTKSSPKSYQKRLSRHGPKNKN